MIPQLAPMKELENSVYKTARARFIAARRLESRQVSLVRFIIVLTLVQLVISTSLLIYNSPHAALVSVLSITVSLLIAIVSNSEPVSKDVLHAHLLHKCGMDLMSLYRKIRAASDSSNFDKYSKEYDNILINCIINHDPVDFNLSECLADKDKKEICPLLKIWHRVRYWIKTYEAFLFYAALTSILCFIAYFFLFSNNFPRQ